jgi:hypothetical protein
MQGYHFPPPEPDPGYGYAPQPQLAAQPQWGQPADPRAYELSYQAYSGGSDPSPFAQATPHQQHGYAEQDADYGEDYFEDEEPRRGRRWVLIAAALVGAIGVGGALAYTYRSLVAPHSGRVPVVRADPTVKVKPAAVGERSLPGRSAEPPALPPPAANPESAQEEPPAESANLGPRVVRPIPINPGGVASASEPPPSAPSVPGITLYRPPAQQQPPAAAPAASPPALASAQPSARPAPPPVKSAQPPGRVVIGTRPTTPPPERGDEPSEAPQPPKRAVQTAALATRAPLAKPREASSGLGFVAVLSSKKSRMDALTEYADMREKYPNVLGDKTPDVQEADLSARGLGTMYRLVVGPPGSHNAASGVCAQLKSAGYVGCWVKEY